jgi:hypothetical protein
MRFVEGLQNQAKDFKYNAIGSKEPWKAYKQGHGMLIPVLLKKSSWPMIRV